MNSFNVLRDVSETIKRLLIKENIQENISGLSENTIVFDSPGDIEPNQEAVKLSIFLYQIVENSQLRNIGSEPVGNIGIKQKIQYPPVILDLSFIFTPYAKDKDTELIIIERVVRIMHDNSILRGDILQGKLKESSNNEIKIVPNTLSLEELNKLWGMFPNKPFKLSLSYLLTPVKIPSERQIDTTRVLEKSIDMYMKV